MSSSIEVEVPVAGESPPIPPTSVGRNALETLLFRAGGMPFTFAISVVTSRFLLPTGRGAYVLALLTVTMATTVLGSVGVSATHELTRRGEASDTAVGDAVVLSVVLGIAGVAVLLPIDLALAEQGFHKVAYVAIALPAVLVVQTLTSVLVAVGRLRSANALQLLLPIVTLGTMLAFVRGLHRGTTGAVAAWVIAQFVVGILALVVTAHLWWRPRLTTLWDRRAWAMLLYGLRLGVVNLVSLLNYRVELILLELTHGLAGVGIYSLATSLAELLWMMSTALATATVPQVVSAETDRAAAESVARSARTAFVATATAGVAIGVVGWFAIPRVFGAYFVGARLPFELLIPGIVAFAPGSVIAAYFSLRQGRVKYPLRFSLLSLGITTVLAIALTGPYGATGAAIACVIGYVAGITGALAAFVREARLPLRDLCPSTSDLRTYVTFAAGLARR